MDHKSLAVGETHTHILMVRHRVADHTDSVEVELHRDPVKGENHTGLVVAGILHMGFAVEGHRRGLVAGEYHTGSAVAHTPSTGPDWSPGTLCFSLLVNY